MYLDSVSTTFSQVANTLKTVEWFNAALFPVAIFKARSFKKLIGDQYQANGTLTIRDKTVPVVLNFSLDEYGPQSAKVTGSTMIKRTKFGIGQGEWLSTAVVKDEVQVNFVLEAISKS